MPIRAARFALLLLFCSILAFAQSETATLRGTVHNTTGESLAGVTVVITEANTLEIRHAITDQTGNYEAGYLLPGSYKIDIAERGYQTYMADGIGLEPGQVRRVDPELTAGSAEDTVEVHFGSSLIDTQTGALRAVIDNKVRWDDAPVVNKNPSPFPLMTTVPGVQGNGRAIVISGVSPRNRQTWQVDGVPDDVTPGQYNHPGLFEFMQVNTANPGPDSYRPTGFDLVSKRGTDDFHGQIFYQYGSSRLDAKPPFGAANSYTVRDPGGEFAGRFFKGYTYFFGGWLYHNSTYSQTLYANVPTAQMRIGNFAQYLNPQLSPTGQVTVIRDPRNGVPFPNNQIPANRVAQVSTNTLTNYYPAPNIGDVNSVLQNYSWTHLFGPDLYVGNWPFIRIDQKITSGNNVYVRYMNDLVSNLAPGTIGEALTSTQARKYKSLVISDHAELTPHFVNYFTFARTTDLVRQGESEGKFNPITGNQVLNTTGIQGTNLNGFSSMGFPQIDINGFTGLGLAYEGGYSNNRAQNDGFYSIREALTWTRGRHAVRFGGDYTRYHWILGTVPVANYGIFTFNGMFTGVPFADFLLGLPGTSSRVLNPRIDDKMHQHWAGTYLTDTVRVTDRLTLDLGLRWDYFGSPVYDDGYMYNWDPATGNIIVAPGTITAVSTLLPKTVKVVVGNPVPKPKMTNIRPRASLAYRLTGTTVLRAGFGEFTDGGGFGPNSGRINDPNGPYRVVETYINTNTNGNAAFSFPKPFPATVPSTLATNESVTALPAKTDEGVIRQYHVTLERALKFMAVRASYVGARGDGLNYTLDINKPRASAVPFSRTRLPYPQFGSTIVTRADGQWHYDSAVVEAQKRAGNLLFDASFTYSNDVANYLNTFDPYNVTGQWTRDPATRRKYFVASALWPLPIGKGTGMADRILRNWTFQAIATVASGQYYSPYFTGPDPANASPTFVTALPDCTGNPNAGARTQSLWFNPAAFAVPAATAGRYGTCGMNSLEGYPIHVVHASLAKRIRITEALSAVFTAQVSNVFNITHYTLPSNNLSNPGAGAFSAASVVPDYWPERQGPRQMDLKLRFQW
jgi:hypothetical protein